MEKPSKSEQNRIFAELSSKSQISIENGAFAISDSWLRSYTNFLKSFAETFSSQIDNSDIFEEGRIKVGLIEDVNFKVVTKEVWETLRSWYEGGPEIKLNVVMGQDGIPCAVTRYYPITLRFKVNEKKHVIHNYMQVRELATVGREIFSITENEEIRLIDFFNGYFYNLMEDDEKLLRYNLSPDQIVLIDHKNEEGKWVNEKKQFTSSYTVAYASHPGLCGLNNLGNTCFFNSGTQCLAHTMPLVNVFLDGSWENWINITNKLGLKGKLATAFANLVKNMWSGNPSSVIRPSELKNAIGSFMPRFAGFQQHDSHELLLFMLDGIHEDLNRCLTRPYLESIAGDGTNDVAVADESWKRHKQKNDSVVVDLFHGLLRSELMCPKCNKTTIVFDPYVSISLPIPKNSARTISIYFASYSLNDKWIPLSISLSVNNFSNLEAINNSVSQKLSRSVHCIPVTFVPRHDSFSFGFNDDNSNNSGQILIAYEIPDSTKFYALFYFVGSVSKKYYPSSEEEKVIGPLFLLQFEDPSPSPEFIIGAMEKRIECIYDKSIDIELSEEAKEILNLIKPKEVPFETTFCTENGNNESTANKSKVIPIVFQNLIKVQVDLSKVNLKIILQNSGITTPSSYSTKSQKSSVSLSECLDFLSEPDILDDQNMWFCPHCREFVCAKKKFDIWNTPEILIIHIKRFSGSGWGVKKDNTYVDYPDVLDMAKYIKSPNVVDPMKYRLYAISEHMGGMGGGHYIAHARVSTSENDEGRWYCFNDSSCSLADDSSAHSSEAYILFYRRIKASSEQ